jgi:hypothetical protein
MWMQLTGSYDIEFLQADGSQFGFDKKGTATAECFAAALRPLV